MNEQEMWVVRALRGAIEHNHEKTAGPNMGKGFVGPRIEDAGPARVKKPIPGSSNPDPIGNPGLSGYGPSPKARLLTALSNKLGLGRKKPMRAASGVVAPPLPGPPKFPKKPAGRALVTSD